MAVTPLNNTYKHISDQSKYNVFNPSGTNYPSTVTNVQDALAMTSPTSYATTTAPGVILIASQAEVLAGVDTTKAVTPATLTARLAYPDATTTVKGILFLATNAEAQAGTNTAKGIVPSSLKYTLDWYWANRLASETATGVLKLSTAAAAAAGTDDTTAMTPLKVKQAIAAATSQIPSYTGATESASGTVQLATIGQVTQGTLRDGFAVSPYTLANLTGNTSRRGIVQAATLAQANLGTDDSLYISAKGFKTFIATTTDFGTTKLTKVVGSGAAGSVLSYDANVLATTGGTMTGALTVNSNITATGTITQAGNVVVDASSINKYTPIGTIVQWPSSTLPSSGIWALCDGGTESTTNRAALFAVIGYNFGGNGTIFNRPTIAGAGSTYVICSQTQYISSSDRNTVQIPLNVPSDVDLTNTSSYGIQITLEATHEAFGFGRTAKGININAWSRSGTNRIGYNGNITVTVVKNNSSASENQVKYIIRVA